MINDFYVTRKKNLRENTHLFHKNMLYEKFSFYFKTDLLNEHMQEFPTIIFNIEKKEFEINLNNLTKILRVLTTVILPIQYNEKVKRQFLLSIHTHRHGIVICQHYMRHRIRIVRHPFHLVTTFFQSQQVTCSCC